MRATTLFALASALFSSLSLARSVLARPVVNERGANGPALRFPYGQTKVRGVNLGGWLVLEVRD